MKIEGKASNKNPLIHKLYIKIRLPGVHLKAGSKTAHMISENLLLIIP